MRDLSFKETHSGCSQHFSEKKYDEPTTTLSNHARKRDLHERFVEYFDTADLLNVLSCLCLGMQFGTVSIIIGIVLLLLWIPIREKPGLATVLNVLLVGAFANVTLAIVQSPGSAFLRSLWFVTGLILAGLGTVLYLGSQLGAGPRDGLMLGLSRRKGWSVSRTRTGLEVLVLILGWVLGGAVGIGTVIFALTIGPTIQFIASKAGQDLARQTVPS